MIVRYIANTFKRTYDRRGMLIYVFTLCLCVISSTVYADMQRITNSNYVLLILCGGLTGKSDFAILFSFWIIPAMIVTFLSGTAASRECEGYKYISPRYGNRNTWLFCEIANAIINSICYSLILIAIGVLACLLNRKLTFFPLNPFILNRDTAAFQYWISDKFAIAELLVMSILRFMRIELVLLFTRMLPKYHTQVGVIVVLVIEILSLINTKDHIFLFTYFSASLTGVSLSFALITGVAGILCIIGIGISLFFFAAQSGQA